MSENERTDEPSTSSFRPEEQRDFLLNFKQEPDDVSSVKSEIINDTGGFGSVLSHEHGSEVVKKEISFTAMSENGRTDEPSTSSFQLEEQRDFLLNVKQEPDDDLSVKSENISDTGGFGPIHLNQELGLEVVKREISFTASTFASDGVETLFQDENGQKHLRKITDGRSYECNDCDKKFILRRYLKRHERTHTGQRPFECGQCGKKFSVRASVKRHELVHTGQKPFECGQCGKKFRFRADLKRHELIHTGQKFFECSHCRRKFTQNTNMRRHLRIHTE